MSVRRAPWLLALTVAMFASAPARAETYPVDSPAWQAAVGAGVAYWGSLPCGGEIAYEWTDLPNGILGHATWMQSSRAPADASLFTDCRIALDPDAELAPDDFCTVLAHELGHLHGHGHSADPADLMAPSQGEPIAQCVDAMAPFQPAPAATTTAVKHKPAKKHKPRAKPRRHRKAPRRTKSAS
jgi:hypothetical protein